MSDLVQIPYQPECWTTPALLARLQDANARAGHNILINGADGAWRSQEEQVGYWDAYQAYLNGGPWAAIASNPYTGQRNHMRGAAVDILNRSDIPYMLAAGFLQDPDEWWHFNIPGWENMPIISTNTAVTGGGATPIVEDDMLTDIQAAQLQAIWTWMGGGQTYTEFAKLHAEVASVKADTNAIYSDVQQQLANESRLIKASDIIQWWINGNPTDSPNTSIRHMLNDLKNELEAWLAKHP